MQTDVFGLRLVSVRLERRHFDAVDHVLVAFKTEDEEFAVGDGKRVRLDHFGQSERLFNHGALGINHIECFCLLSGTVRM